MKEEEKRMLKILENKLHNNPIRVKVVSSLKISITINVFISRS